MMVFSSAREQHRYILHNSGWRAPLPISTKRQIVSRMASVVQDGLGLPRVAIGRVFACADVEVLQVCCQLGC
jgi:hypothetical protein